MTVMCRADGKGFVQWTLTWESGKLPNDCCIEGFCVYCARSSAIASLTRGYVVLVVTSAIEVGASQWSEILFSRMCYEATHVLRMVLPGLCAGVDGDNIMMRQHSLELVEAGLCSSGAAFRCTDKRVCQDCRSVEEEERLFVYGTVFQGDKPYGEQNPFLGASDCPLNDLGDGWPWLSCPSRPQRTMVLDMMADIL
jgi:hypothetical protein